MASEESAMRIAELMTKYQRLKQWGVWEKLPKTRETQKNLDKFFAAALNGEIDVSDVQGATIDVQKLETYAVEYDAAHRAAAPYLKENLRTSHDVENTDDSLRVGKKVVDASNEARAVARDAAKDGFSLVKDAAKQVPWWGWAAGGTLVLTYLLSQIAAISRAFGGSSK